MENEKSTGNKFTVKDAAIIGIFCAVMFVVFMVYSTLTGASLFYSMIFNAAGAALILAPFYVYMCMKVGKHGPALVYNIMWAIIAGLMMGPFMIPWFLGGGIIAELSMCGKDAYEELDGRVSSAIKRINGDMLRGKEIYPMSSGEKQKIAVASVNAVDPEIYVFDEPSANLDMYSVEALKNLMGGLKAEGHTIIVAEHRLYYLTDLADRFLYMENGSIKEEWTAGELLSIPEEKRRAIGIRAADLHHIEVDIPPTKEKDMTMEVKDLAFSYRKHPVFHDISFRAYAGDLIAIVGHNGIGKTTLSNILCGMQKEKEGQVIYNGTKVSKGKRKNFAYFVMQNTDCQLFGDSVEEELLLNGKGSTQEQRDDLLKLYGLFEWKERHPATLSGGQKQRLALAVSDWIDTPVLILDEPTSGLDFKNMMRISEHLKALAQKGKTILIITHDYEFAAMTCNRVLHFVDEGHVETFSLQENLPRLYSCLMCQ